MYVIFMEIAGVLQSRISHRHNDMLTRFRVKSTRITKPPALCPIIMQSLSVLLEDDLDIRLVLFDAPQAVSTARLKSILKGFEDAGLPPSFVIDYVPNEEGVLRQVALWRTQDSYPNIDEWVIVAAEPVEIGDTEAGEVFGEEMSRLVMTDPDDGLTKDNCSTVFDILCGQGTTEVVKLNPENPFVESEDDEDDDGDGEEVIE